MPSSASELARTGFLLKEGQKVKTWKQRYFVVNSEVLRYYTDDDMTEKKGEMSLVENVTVMPEFRSPDQDVDWKFVITTAKRELKCAAPTEKEMQAWIQVIRNIVKSHETNATNKRASLAGLTQDQREIQNGVGTNLSRVAQLRAKARLGQDPAKLYGVEWQKDAEIRKCSDCKKLFAGGVEKHHCRFCGKIYCSFCSRFQLEHPNTPGQPQRTCTKCFKKNNRQGRPSGQTSSLLSCICCRPAASKKPSLDLLVGGTASTSEAETETQIVRSVNDAASI